MNDLVAVAIFFGCLISTLGLLRLCERLRPRVKGERAREVGTIGGKAKEPRS